MEPKQLSGGEILTSKSKWVYDEHGKIYAREYIKKYPEKYYFLLEDSGESFEVDNFNEDLKKLKQVKNGETKPYLILFDLLGHLNLPVVPTQVLSSRSQNNNRPYVQVELDQNLAQLLKKHFKDYIISASIENEHLEFYKHYQDTIKNQIGETNHKKIYQIIKDGKSNRLTEVFKKNSEDLKCYIQQLNSFLTSFEIKMMLKPTTIDFKGHLVFESEEIVGVPQPWDWVGIFKIGEKTHHQWYYYKKSLSFSVNQPGTFECRYFRSGDNTKHVSVSNAVEVEPKIILVCKNQGNVVTVSCNLISGTFPTNTWCGLFEQSHSNFGYEQYFSMDSNSTLIFKYPSKPGKYEFRLISGNSLLSHCNLDTN